jgi:DNA-binding beta-propeller fold protein YncE
MGYRVLGRLPFPDLHAGWWLTNRQVQGETVVRHWDPGIALTPDGRQIALVDGVSHQLTVIDAATLRLVRRVPLLERRGLLAQFGSWLGFLPETAEAKGMGTDGVSLDAWFSLDGQRLYLTGTTGRVTRGNSLRTTDLGLRVVDVSSGTIVATRFRGQNPLDVILSPDGRSLYVTLPGATTGRTIVGCPCSMERLDARTLRTRAVRRSLGTATTVPRLVAVPVPGAP